MVVPLQVPVVEEDTDMGVAVEVVAAVVVSISVALFSCIFN